MDVSAPRGLAELAEHEGADLIVIGSSHHGAVGRVVFGSVGERLLYGAPCCSSDRPARLRTRGARRPGADRGQLDGTAESELALASAKELATALDGELRLITVIPELSVRRARRALDEGRCRRGSREASKRALREVGSLPVEEAIEEETHRQCWSETAWTWTSFVIGSRGYGPVRPTLLGGVSAEVMRTAPCPVVGASRRRGRPITGGRSRRPAAPGRAEGLLKSTNLDAADLGGGLRWGNSAYT